MCLKWVAVLNVDVWTDVVQKYAMPTAGFWHCDGMFEVAVLNVEVWTNDVLWYAMSTAESCSPLRGVSLLDECMT